MKTLTHPAEEIRSYLAYDDYSLAIRRLLDLSLDAGDPTLMRSAIAVSRLFHQQEEQPSAALKQQALDLLTSMEATAVTDRAYHTLIVAENISKQFSASRFRLNPLSLRINNGDVLGVVGENGNGKTTLLRCLAGQLALDSGAIHFPRLPKADYYSIKHHVAFIPQRIPRWFGQLKDNLHFSASIAGIIGKENELMVDFMLERLNLSAYALLTWDQISSGYRTRFEIARILLQRPSLLILDEPLANLDINAQQTILTDLRYIAKSAYQPMGVILSSQQLHEVEKVADTVLFIKNGSCLFRTDEGNAGQSFAIELETDVAREALTAALGNEVTISFNGGFYTIEGSMDPADVLRGLVQHNIPVRYFRDITHSTKRFF